MSFDKAEVKREVDSEEMKEETTQKVYVKVEGVKVLVGEGRRICKVPQKRKLKEDETPQETKVAPPKKRPSRAAREKELREQRRMKETPEEMEERRRKARECKREQRRRQREKEQLLGKKREKVRDEKAEERHRRRLELQRERRRTERRLLEKVPETEEEKKKREELEEKRRQKEFDKLVKRATMTEEEIEADKMHKFLARQAYKAREGRWRDRPEEVKEKARRQNRAWVANLEGERKQRWKESTRRATKKYLERLKMEGNVEKYPYISPEYQKMRVERMKAKGTWERLKERAKEYQRRRYATETPKEREKRKWKEKVNGARRRLKKRLKEEGVQVEEIGRRDEELRVQMWREFDPDNDLTQKKPRGRKPKEWAAKVPTKVKVVEDKQNEQRLQPPCPHPPYCTPFPTSPQKNGTQPCTAPGGINEAVIEGDEDHFSPPPPPHAAPFPSPSKAECQQVTEPQSCHSSNFKKDVSPPPMRSRDTLQCSHCPLEFPTDSQLRSHILACHPSKCWKCPKCKEVVLSPLELSRHYSTAHKPINPDSAPVKKPVNDNPGCNFLCICCPTDASPRPQFKTRLELFSHVKQKHRKSFWPCDYCNLLKYSRKSLHLHLQICRRHRMEAI